jgi:hypothetical protein
MREWFRAQLAAGLPALSGSAVSGTIALKQEMLNELLAGWLADTSSSGAATPAMDVSRVKPLVKEATVRTEAGTLFVDFRIAI